jgi:hypothetical protein
MEVAGDALAFGVAGVDRLLEQPLAFLGVLGALELLRANAAGEEDEESLQEHDREQGRRESDDAADAMQQHRSVRGPPVADVVEHRGPRVAGEGLASPHLSVGRNLNDGRQQTVVDDALKRPGYRGRGSVHEHAFVHACDMREREPRREIREEEIAKVENRPHPSWVHSQRIRTGVRRGRDDGTQRSKRKGHREMDKQPSCPDHVHAGCRQDAAVGGREQHQPGQCKRPRVGDRLKRQHRCHATGNNQRANEGHQREREDYGRGRRLGRQEIAHLGAQAGQPLVFHLGHMIDKTVDVGGHCDTIAIGPCAPESPRHCQEL